MGWGQPLSALGQSEGSAREGWASGWWRRGAGRDPHPARAVCRTPSARHPPSTTGRQRGRAAWTGGTCAWRLSGRTCQSASACAAGGARPTFTLFDCPFSTLPRHCFPEPSHCSLQCALVFGGSMCRTRLSQTDRFSKCLALSGNFCSPRLHLLLERSSSICIQ